MIISLEKPTLKSAKYFFGKGLTMGRWLKIIFVKAQIPDEQGILVKKD